MKKGEAVGYALWLIAGLATIATLGVIAKVCWIAFASGWNLI